MVLVLREAVNEADGHHVLAAVLQRVDAEHAADVLNVGFARKHGLRDAVAAHRARGGAVREHSVGVAVDVRAGIQLRERAHALGDDAVAVGGVSALVREALDLARGERAVRPYPRDDVRADGVAHAVADERLLARAVELDEAAAHDGGEVGAQRLIQRVLLVAEAAADIRLDDADLAPGDAESLPDDAADDVRDLRGGVDDDAPGLHGGEAHVVFDVAVLHGRRVVPALDLDKARLAAGLLIVAVADGRVGEDVVREFLVQQRGIGLHGLLHVQHEGIFLIFHAQRAQGLRGGDLILRDDGGDVIAVEAHAGRQQQAVGDVLMVRIGRPRMACRGEFDLRHVKAGDDLHDALDLLGGARVDGLDHAVCDGRMQHARDERTAVTEVIAVLCAPGCLVECVHTADALANLHGGPSFWIAAEYRQCAQILRKISL